MREIAKLGNFRFHIEWTVVNGGKNQLKGFVDARQAELFFPERDSNFVNSVNIGFASSTESNRSSG